MVDGEQTAITIRIPKNLKEAAVEAAELNETIASLTFAQYQLLSYVMPGLEKKYADRYGDTWGKDFESQMNRTQAVANLMRVNLLKRMESSISSFRITLSRILGGANDLLAKLDSLESGYTYEDETLDDELDGENRVYFVTETKGGGNADPTLRPAEKAKIDCAKKHFAALGLGDNFEYDVKTTYAVVRA